MQTYFLAGLVAGADLRLRGTDSTVRAALDVANSRLHRLLPWAIVTATVSHHPAAIERFGIVGRIVAGLVGLAWNLVTFLTMPILVLEDLGVGDALKRSKDLFKKTWGENVIGQAGFGLVGFVAMLPGIALIAHRRRDRHRRPDRCSAGSVWCGWSSVARWSPALSGIYRTALYRFAATARCPPTSPTPTSRAAFEPRQRRRHRPASAAASAASATN